MHNRPYNPVANADLDAFRCVAIRAADAEVALAAENGADFAGITAKPQKADERITVYTRGMRAEVIVDTALDLSNGRELTVGASGGVKEVGANTAVALWLPREGETTVAAGRTVIVDIIG